MPRIDLIIFGASGYTGTFVVREAAKLFKQENFSWAIAGRSKEKLDKTIDSISTELGIDLSSIERLIVDVKNDESIRDMCEKGKLIINCVGPYRFYGEQVVRKCIETKTHHIDVSGEPEFLETMQLKYNQEALDKNIFIVGACGFDSIPVDIGLVLTKKNFPYELSYVESFLTIEANFGLNYATWESAVHGFASSKNLQKIRKQIFQSRIPKPAHSAPKRTNAFGFFYDQELKKYCMNFMGSDKSVVQRSQYFNYKILNQRPMQFVPYFTIKSIYHVAIIIFWGAVFSILARYKLGRALLLKHYKFFSFGLAIDRTTSNVDYKDDKYSILFRGSGYDDKLPDNENSFKTPPNKKITCKITTPDIYVSTGFISLFSALTILNEQDRIPVRGGVLTPGAAFANTSLADRLLESGITFEVIKNDLESKTGSKL